MGKGIKVHELFVLKDIKEFKYIMTTNELNEVLYIYCNLINLGYLNIDLIDAIGVYRIKKSMKYHMRHWQEVVGLDEMILDHMINYKYIEVIEHDNISKTFEEHDEFLLDITELLCNITRYGDRVLVDPLKSSLKEKYKKMYEEMICDIWINKYGAGDMNKEQFLQLL